MGNDGRGYHRKNDEDSAYSANLHSNRENKVLSDAGRLTEMQISTETRNAQGKQEKERFSSLLQGIKGRKLLSEASFTRKIVCRYEMYETM